jgi:Protein of unknown function (DUF3631)/Bifunctional DNA primase/polymerase, N-terminal
MALQNDDPFLASPPLTHERLRIAVTARRIAYLKLGYEPIPILSSRKRPAISGWQDVRITIPPDEDVITPWADTHPGALSTGIRTRYTPGFDIDIHDPDLAEQVEQALLNMIPQQSTILKRVGLPPKRLIPFRCTTPFKKISATFKAPDGTVHKVEVLADGQQFVAEGIHETTHQPYRWADNVNLLSVAHEHLPLVDEALARRFVTEASEIMRRAGWIEVDAQGKLKTNDKRKVNGKTGNAGADSIYYRSALKDECTALAAMPKDSGRNNALNSAAFNLFQLVAGGGLDENEVCERLYAAAEACGLVAEDGAASVRATIESGAKAGRAQPRQAPDHNGGRSGRGGRHDGQAGDQAADQEPPPELTNDVIINLAGMTPLQYAQQLAREAKKYKTPVKLLEKAVEAARIGQEAEKLLEPHWEVKLAEDPVDAAELFAEVEARILQHVVMPKDLAFVVALWVGQSWIHQHGTYSPILGVTSAERDSGKSTLMGVIAFLVRRSLLSVGVSAAALYRSIEKWNPTFVVDEADDAFVDNPDLRQVINSGWTRGQGVMRCDPDTNEPRRFPTFCPKAIALKGKKMPDTMLSRTIFIEMKRRLRSEKVDHFRHLDDAGFARMRSQLARWAQDSGEALGLAQAAQPEGFMNRTASNWQLMFAIADSLGEEAGARARTIAQHIAGVTDMASAGVALLQDIKTMFEASTLDHLTSKAIINNLTADPEKRWAEWSRGKPISEKGVAGLLHEYRIVSRNVGPRAAQTKGYRKADFEDAWERYLTPEAEKAEGGLDSDILPSTRPPPCNNYAFAEKTAVDGEDGGREKNGHFSREINAVDGWTRKTSEIAPSVDFNGSDPGPIPDCLIRAPKVARPPALGPEGDNLDDLQ